MLEDVGLSVVGAGADGVCWSQEGDEGAFEPDGHVEGGGVVGDDEFGAFDDGHEVGDAGGAHPVGDSGVSFGEFEEGGAVEAFSGASDDDDSAEGGVVGEFLCELGETFDGPALGGPGAGGGEDGVGLGVFDDDLGALFVVGVEGDVGVGDIRACGFGELEHAIDGVDGDGRVDAVVVEDPGEL